MSRFLWFVAACAAILSPTAARAQFSEMMLSEMAASAQSRALVGQGASVITKLPQSMRCSVEIAGRGKTIEAALEALQKTRAAAEKQLVEMGFQADSIHVSHASAENSYTQRQKQMQQMMTQRMGNRGGARALQAAKAAQQITVAAVLSAERKLSGKTADELLVECSGLQDKVKAAKLAGEAAASPADEELAEEMEGMSSSFSYGEPEAEPGEPVFAYQATISPEEQKAAMEKAFARAEADAAKKAAIARLKIGPLVSFTCECVGAMSAANGRGWRMHGWNNEFADFGYSINGASPVLQSAIGIEATDEVEEDHCAAMSTETGPLAFRASAVVAYSIEGQDPAKP